ncbi:unnamed protein product, partial [marine sediment metagenome]
LNEELTALQQQLVDMKDTRQQDIDDLRDTITDKETLLENSYTTLEEQQAEYERVTGLHTEFIASLYRVMTTEIMTELEKMYGFEEPAPSGPLVGPTYATDLLGPVQQFARGTHYVPETMPAIVHRGEQIIPAGGQGTGGDNITIYNEIHATINNEMDARELGALLAEGGRSSLLKRGKSTFKVILLNS